MSVSRDDLLAERCVPCEGGVPKLAADEVAACLAELPAWSLSSDGVFICREWTRAFDSYNSSSIKATFVEVMV